MSGVASVSWPDADGRRTVTSRWTGDRLGYVRSVNGRYFPEDADGFPLPGTYRTRHEAVMVVLGNRMRTGSDD